MKKALLLTIISAILYSNLYSQKGSNCASADSISSLPYIATGLTTGSNNITAANVCGDANYGGNDYVFKYKPAANQNVDISLTNTGIGVALYITKGCPSAGTSCFAKSEQIMGNPSLTNQKFDLGTTYYIIVSANSISVSTNFDITITGTTIIDADGGIVSVSEPVSSCGLGSETVAVQIMNYGKNAISNFNVSYKINNLAAVTEQVTQTIQPNGILLYKFTAKADFSTTGNTYKIKAYTSVASDGNKNNDTLATTVTNMTSASSIPYLQDFESGNGGWVSEWDTAANPNNSWKLGKPAKTVINAAASGNNAWVTNLTGNSFTNEASYVLSPCFNFSSATDPYLYLNIWYEGSLGGMNIQYSVNGGKTWLILGQSGEATWYNSPAMYVVQGWIGNSTKWIKVHHSLTTLKGLPKVQFRVYFVGTDPLEGVAFDDFQITEGLLPTGINQTAVENTAYPNPASDAVTINLQEIESVSIYDVLGSCKEVITGSVLSANANKIDVSSFKAGVYVLQIKTATGDKTIKLIVK